MSSEESRDESAPTLKTLLMEDREDLVRHIQRKASGLLRHESAEDLVQGVHLRALEVADRFDYQGRPAFRGWIRKVAQQHISRRHEYWSAKKRRAEKIFRITVSDRLKESAGGGVNPPSPRTGPGTRAFQNELYELALQAMSVLKERDQRLLQWLSEDLSTDEIAAKLDISRDAAERARQRAVERFRKAFKLLTEGGGPPQDDE